MEQVSPLSTSDRRPQRRLWIVFFLFLATLGIVAVVVPIVYNLGLQLKPEDVARARQLWEEKAPRDYDLELMRRENQQGTADEYRIKVRNGRPVAVVGKAEGILLVDETVGLALGPVIRIEPVEEIERFTIEGLFDEIERDLQKDGVAAGKRNYALASFVMKEDGRPTHYVHRVAGTKQRVEWDLKLIRVKEVWRSEESRRQ